MSYKLGQLPSAKATLSEIADFMEYQCLISDENVYSSVSGESAMGISCDDPNSMSDENSDFVDALAEIEDRNSFSCGKYPFETTTNSLTISAGIENGVLEVYKFLLLATRENMSENNYLAISRALRTIEFLIFTPLFNEAKTLNYIRNNKDGIDPTILGICNYLDGKFGYSK